MKLKISYLSFLIQVVKKPNLAIIEAVTLKNNSENQSFKIRWAIEMLNRQVWEEFEGVINNQKLQSQRLQIESVVKFDQGIDKLYILMRKYIYDMKKFISMLSDDFLNLEKIREKAKDLFSRQSVTKQMIRQLFDYNNNNVVLFELTLFFGDYIDFKRQKLKQYIQLSNQLMKQNLKQEDLGINLFNEDSFVISINLLEPLGNIQEVSNNVQNIIGYTKDQLIGKNINMIMPQIIQIHHRKFLNKFCYDSKEVYTISNRLFFCIDIQGFLNPVELRVKLDSSNQEQYRACGYLKKGNTGNDYILFDIDTLKIDSCNQKLFQKVFQKYLNDDVKKLCNMNIGLLFPGLIVMKKTQRSIFRKINFQSTTKIMLIPNNASTFNQIVSQYTNLEANNYQQLSNYLRDIKINEYQMYEVTFIPHYIETKIESIYFNYLEIFQMKRIVKLSSKVELINIMTGKLNKYLGLTLRMRVIRNNMDQVEDIDVVQQQQETYYYQEGLTFKKNSIFQSASNNDSYRDNLIHKLQLQQGFQNTNSNEQAPASVDDSFKKSKFTEIVKNFQNSYCQIEEEDEETFTEKKSETRYKKFYGTYTTTQNDHDGFSQEDFDNENEKEDEEDEKEVEVKQVKKQLSNQNQPILQQIEQNQKKKASLTQNTQEKQNKQLLSDEDLVDIDNYNVQNYYNYDITDNENENNQNQIYDNVVDNSYSYYFYDAENPSTNYEATFDKKNTVFDTSQNNYLVNNQNTPLNSFMIQNDISVISKHTDLSTFSLKNKTLFQEDLNILSNNKIAKNNQADENNLEISFDINKQQFIENYDNYQFNASNLDQIQQNMQASALNLSQNQTNNINQNEAESFNLTNRSTFNNQTQMQQNYNKSLQQNNYRKSNPFNVNNDERNQEITSNTNRGIDENNYSYPLESATGRDQLDTSKEPNTNRYLNSAQNNQNNSENNKQKKQQEFAKRIQKLFRKVKNSIAWIGKVKQQSFFVRNNVESKPKDPYNQTVDENNSIYSSFRNTARSGTIAESSVYENTNNIKNDSVIENTPRHNNGNRKDVSKSQFNTLKKGISINNSQKNKTASKFAQKGLGFPKKMKSVSEIENYQQAQKLKEIMVQQPDSVNSYSQKESQTGLKKRYINTILSQKMPSFLIKSTILTLFAAASSVITSLVVYQFSQSQSQLLLTNFGNTFREPLAVVDVSNAIRINELYLLYTIKNQINLAYPLQQERNNQQRNFAFQLVNTLYQYLVSVYRDNNDEQAKKFYLYSDAELYQYLNGSQIQRQTKQLIFFDYIMKNAWMDTQMLGFNNDPRLDALSNYYNFFNSQLNGTDINQIECQSILDNNQNTMQINIILQIILNYSCAILIFPLYYFSQLKRENYLKLFTSFNGDKIVKLFELYEEADMVFETNDVLQFIGSTNQQSISQYIQQPVVLANKKKRSSNIEALPKINCSIVLLVIIIIIIISIYPILSYTLVVQQAVQFQNNLYELVLFCRSALQIAQSYTTMYVQINQISHPTIYTEANSFIQLQIQLNIQDILTRNQQVLDDLVNIQNSTQSSSRYNWNQYSNIIINPIQNDICQAIQSNLPVFSTANVTNNFDLNKCQTTYNGIMQSGALITLKTIFTIFQEFINISQNTNNQNFQTKLQSWDEGVNLQEMDKLFDQIEQWFYITIQYQMYNGNQFYSYLQSIQLYLFYYQLLITILIFGFGLSYFSRFLSKSVNKTKFLISIIHIEALIENPYVVSFFRKQSDFQDI
ncbi:PAS domain S-box protein (macronuclear) [Tetrahymena thermophila SB210]|uniref:PAS domain S-box protein n=1 Tax=Tetrahymena thermophila (strain SB210) TaxID=312017 RepID=I7LWN8_TETTS|nr:PAS domain S-box protein [Tetrahymena thermophila SB210]EAS02434.2 PAS domain S-box protein [Tetrahymena thermophila SB210]|eukprot:XP_001022679.2 PAS domain S-box protein [Tetrahymena thermophila SB210]